MAWLENLSLHFLSTDNCRFEIVDLKPQEHAVPVRLKIWITDRTVMVLHVPSVQLKD